MLIRHLFFFGADSTRPDVCRRSKTSEFLQRGDILYLELLLLAIGLDSKFFFFWFRCCSAESCGCEMAGASPAPPALPQLKSFRYGWSVKQSYTVF